MVLFQPNARHRKQLSANGRKRSKKASLLADLGRKFNHNQVGPRRVRIIPFKQLPSHQPTGWTWFTAASQILLSAWTWNWCNCLAPRWHVHQLNEISDIFSRRDQIRSNCCSSIQAHKLYICFKLFLSFIILLLFAYGIAFTRSVLNCPLSVCSHLLMALVHPLWHDLARSSSSCWSLHQWNRHLNLLRTQHPMASTAHMRPKRASIAENTDHNTVNHNIMRTSTYMYIYIYYIYSRKITHQRLRPHNPQLKKYKSLRVPGVEYGVLSRQLPGASFNQSRGIKRLCGFAALHSVRGCERHWDWGGFPSVKCHMKAHGNSQLALGCVNYSSC